MEVERGDHRLVAFASSEKSKLQRGRRLARALEAHQQNDGRGGDLIGNSTPPPGQLLPRLRRGDPSGGADLPTGGEVN